MTSSGADATMRLVLDTSAYSWLRRGREDVASFVAAADIVLVPMTVLGEIEAGIELGRRHEENRVALTDFLAESFVRLLPITPSVARRYGQLFAQLRRVGMPLPINDVWIAAATLDSGADLLTFDTHFAQVPGLASSLRLLD